MRHVVVVLLAAVVDCWCRNMDIYVRLVTADKCCCVSIQKQTLYYELCRYPDTTDTFSKYAVQKHEKRQKILLA